MESVSNPQINNGVPSCVQTPDWDNVFLITYTVLQNTMVLTGLHSYHNDPDVWGDPQVYRPERFLDENGALLKKDVTLPFGAG
jgi:Cytochrome P450